ncbi:phospholipid-transporting ATPase ABCA3-like [Mercenaria mercenaria]|uniref:phospholipid-transporting ATPase ABCA3-like n=1 Tax=Mercenaria mercenaria TaxID=6596 RepID=UPI00234EA43E|nr:phospholipid-transporting ATPase ABCA3-like [Mercenaria mercenaria]XP_053391297.1 phospholipid-transporting ATPase ABCA3-like [Mercenaria mercenaria]
MGTKGQHFILLLWKNFLIQKRKVWTNVLQIGVPIFFTLMLIFIRLRVKSEMKEKMQWPDCTSWNIIDNSLPHRLAFTPENNVTRRILEKASKTLSLVGIKGFRTEVEMVNFLMFSNSSTNNTGKYLAGVVFSDNIRDGSFPPKISYKLRFSSSPRNNNNDENKLFRSDSRWETQFTFPIFQRVGPREPKKECGGAPGYSREGFLAVQHAINFAVLREVGGVNQSDILDNIDVNLRRHPYPAFNDDNFILVIQQQFPLILMLSFLIVSLSIVKDVVHEKERKLKESLKMMGVNNWLHWSAWFVKYFLFLLITVAIMTLLLCIKTNRGPVIGKTDPSIIFILITVYAVSTISFCFAVSVFFKKANSGAAAGGIFHFLTYIPYFFIQPRYETMTLPQKILTSLIPNTAMAYGGQIIGMYEGTGTGVQWYNIKYGVSVDDNFTLLNVLIMLIIDSFIYGVLTWYVEALFPGEFGVPQKWYFFLTSSYWCGTVPDEHVPEDKNISMGQVPEFFEADPIGIRAGIQIRNLRKEFKSGNSKKVAVCGMTVDMYEGQITALLGHNGAGKTTTMSMLTGFIPPSSGTARVNGYDIRKDISSVRNSLGLCPQHDVLFDTLTVEEHLIFFGKLKGCSSSTIKTEVDNMLRSVKLESKRHEQAKTLSGGMKRKLSVGIALIGGSKVVILDEPSSGMDPDARRHIWSVLQQNRAGRTMVLTTHFMDEADLLGDRIAIMADGAVKCCGTSLFLKNKYGAGYHLTMVKEQDCDIHGITSLIEEHIHHAKLESNVGAELSYILPHEMSLNFESLFSELDSRKSDLGISSYNVSTTTMEEVFLRVGETSVGIKKATLAKQKAKRDRNYSDSRDSSVNNDVDHSNEETPLFKGGADRHANYSGESKYERTASFTHDIDKNTHMVLYVQQFYAMFIKRVLHTYRNQVVTISQLAVPLFFTIMALIAIRTFPGPQDSPRLNLTIDSLGDNVVVYSEQSNSSLENMFVRSYGKQFIHDGSTETVFVNNRTENRNDTDIIKYLLKVGHDDIGAYNLKYLVGADVKPLSSGKQTGLDLTAYFNNQAFHTPAISVAMVANALLQLLTNSTSHYLQVANHPLPRSIQDQINDEFNKETTGFTVAFNIVFGMAFLASSFTLFLIKERATKAKHLQFSSGVNMFSFWPATFCWDLINYLIPAICLLLTLRAFSVDAFVADYNLAHIALLLVLYGIATLPFMYLWSFLFTVPSTGYVWITMFNILSGVATILAVGILRIPQLNLEDLSKVLEWVFLVILPNYCLGQGLEDYYSNYKFKAIYEEFCVKDQFENYCHFLPNPCCRDVTGDCGKDECLDYNANPLGWEANGIGRMLVFLCIQAVVYFFILFLIESEVAHSVLQRVMKKSQRHEAYKIMLTDESVVQEDEDVARERARLANTDWQTLFSSETLVISELTKYYGSNLAVNRISVGIPQGECFGLLGVNGAGKTTTFKMLTGDETVSSGSAYLSGHSIISQIAEVRQKLGYCPQFDALIDQMSGRETLYMYARLRGIHKHQIEYVVNDLLDALLLTEHADKLVQAYSGGNKRKLSTAIALIGNPPVIFLDEPTTGMDPVARRFLWDTLCSIRQSGRTLILTSHSMEECEALCTRLAVMVNGQFKCLGSPQHLKNRFGEGYFLIARVGTTSTEDIPNPEPLMKFIEQKFPGCVLIDIHQGYINYHLTDTTLKLAEIFGTMEKAKANFKIEDYSVSQTTLEQVFLNFARAQVPPNNPGNGCCGGFCLACGLFSSCCRTRTRLLPSDFDESISVHSNTEGNPGPTSVVSV